ncbi:radical SAM protein [Pyrinomonas methylaliphatogenes]|uniref:Predicted Fe-S oxidoreductase n=1 Tax=Pyrinomonas methylaliphatogenes TaxID=454194 RepID=A0A0B6X379_9BACT|nr:radical SAM protein [Pyrinomonas methylaliphatogenes]CDM66969.1 predicted Fe-S oxidoreductase [Pyrinomonas methylaliphatogenes]
MFDKARQLARLIRSTARERKLDTLIFFVTSRCNARCETCFYWRELNRPGDLTFEQIERISRTAPRIGDLWLSGGEPTLRRDLAEIIDLFVTNNGVRRVIIPTNALVKERVYATVEHVLSRHEALHLYLNIALDGLGETHDRIRGVPGNWERTLACIRTLGPLKKRFEERFRLNVNTVVCAENYFEIERLADYLWENFDLDGHYFNLVRGETKKGEAIKRIPPEVLPAIYARIARLTKRYGDRMFAADDAATRFVKNLVYVGAITTHYRVQVRNFERPSEWPMPCTAGETIAVIDYNGDVRACELRGRFARLADYDFDFGALWASEARQTELRAIDGGRACWCTHVCFIHDSMRHSRRAMLWELPKNYVTRSKWQIAQETS